MGGCASSHASVVHFELPQESDKICNGRTLTELEEPALALNPLPPPAPAVAKPRRSFEVSAELSAAYTAALMGCNNHLESASNAAGALARQGSQPSTPQPSEEPPREPIASEPSTQLPPLEQGTPQPPPQPPAQLHCARVVPGDRFASELTLLKHVFAVPTAYLSLHHRPKPLDIATSTTLMPVGLVVVEDVCKQAPGSLPAIPEPLRCFASTPLLAAEGTESYGDLCVGDIQPRTFLPSQFPILAHFASIISRELERDHRLQREQEEMQAARLQLAQTAQGFGTSADASLMCNVQEAGWPVLQASPGAAELAGVPAHLVQGTSLWQLFELVPTSMYGSEESLQQAVSLGMPFTVTCRASRKKRVRVCSGTAAAEVANNQRGALEGTAVDMAIAGRASADTAVGAFAAAAAPPPDDGWLSITFTPPTGDSAAPQAARPGRWHASLQPCAGPLNNGLGSLADPGSLSSSSTAGQGGARLKLRPDSMQDVQLGSLLGVGASGRTYRGIWHGSRVAVKIIDVSEVEESMSQGGDDSDNEGEGAIISGLLKSATTSQSGHGNAPLVEADLAKSLSHPHIVATHAYGVCSTTDGGQGKQHKQIWIVQELCSKGTLAQAVQAGKFKNPTTNEPNIPFILLTAIEIASALAYLHSVGVVHGDLSGNNVLLNPATKDKRFFTALVADFGLSRPMELKTSLCTGTCGTVSYMPAELIIDGKLSRATDIYSYGVLLWEMLTGERSWAGMSGIQIINAVTVNRRSLPIREAWPAQIQDLIRRCLDFNPKQRPTAKALLVEVQGVLEAMLQPRRASTALP